ncbi:MAG: PrgI family protein [bacterium]|nr:PrgI family protein [bacterium]
MEYQVPQFIEVEDKIVGTLTLKQFIYLAGGAGLCVLTFFSLPFLLFVVVAPPIAAFALALAFYKMNGKPFVEILEAAFSYYIGAKLFLWRKEAKPEAKLDRSAVESPDAPHGGASRGAPKLTSDKLHELAWSLDVKNNEQALGPRP